MAVLAICGVMGAEVSMSTAHEFIAATLEARSGPIASAVDWSAPEAVAVTARLELPGAPPEASYRWQVPATAAADGQAALAALRAARGGAGPVTLPEAPVAPDEAEARRALAALSHLRYSEAAAAHAAGAALSARGETEAALRAFEAGIEALGDLYQSPDLIDDTGMKLAMGRAARTQGRTVEAAALLSGVLESRLAAYREKEEPREAERR